MIIGLDHQLITLFNNVEPRITDYIYDGKYYIILPRHIRPLIN